MELSGKYVKRPIRFLHLAESRGWKIKVYGISAHRERPLSTNVAAAEDLAENHLPQPAVLSQSADEQFLISESRYGVGVLIVHEAREGVFVLISWWAGENMLQHHVFFSPTKEASRFLSLASSGIIACVWELAVLGFERQTWIDMVLNNPAGPDLDRYLGHNLSADV